MHALAVLIIALTAQLTPRIKSRAHLALKASILTQRQERAKKRARLVSSLTLWLGPANPATQDVTTAPSIASETKNARFAQRGTTDTSEFARRPVLLANTLISSTRSALAVHKTVLLALRTSPPQLWFAMNAIRSTKWTRWQIHALKPAKRRTNTLIDSLRSVLSVIKDALAAVLTLLTLDLSYVMCVLTGTKWTKRVDAVSTLAV